MSVQHEALTYAEQHVIHRWVYADATARTDAIGFTSDDVRKLAYQEDTDAYWVLTNHSPITWSQVTVGNVYTQSEVDALLAAMASVPTGAIQAFGGSSAPTGYFICNGAAINRTTYATLFAVIGENYGAGDGATTFNVPDLRGNFPRGKNADSLGDTDGAETQDLSHYHTTGDWELTEDEMPAHTHYIETYVNSPPTSGGHSRNLPVAGGVTPFETESAGSGDPHNHGSTSGETPGLSAQDVMNPYLVVNYIIKT